MLVILTNKLFLPPKKGKIISSSAFETLAIVAQIMPSCSFFDVQVIFPFLNLKSLHDFKHLYQVSTHSPSLAYLWCFYLTKTSLNCFLKFNAQLIALNPNNCKAFKWLTNVFNFYQISNNGNAASLALSIPYRQGLIA